MRVMSPSSEKSYGFCNLKSAINPKTADSAHMESEAVNYSEDLEMKLSLMSQNHKCNYLINKLGTVPKF